MALTKSMVSSKSDDWVTPWEFFNRLNEEFHFTLDPAADKTNTKCKKYFTVKKDGLKQDWSKDIVFVNPPYKRQTATWVKKSYEESLKGATVVMLLSAGTGRIYWHEIIFKYAAQIRWVRGFIKFSGRNETAPFASAIVIFDKKKKYRPKYVYNYLARLKK